MECTALKGNRPPDVKILLLLPSRRGWAHALPAVFEIDKFRLVGVVLSVLSLSRLTKNGI